MSRQERIRAALLALASEGVVWRLSGEAVIFAPDMLALRRAMREVHDDVKRGAEGT